MGETIQLDELDSFINSLAHDTMRNHEKIFADKTRSVKRTSEAIVTIASRLEVAIKNAWGSIDKTTSEQGIRLTETIKEAARQLATEEVNFDYASSETFHKTAVDTLNRIIRAIKKYVPKLHRVLKSEVASLNSTLNKLEVIINSLGVSLDESPGSQLETLRLDIKNIQEKDNALRELKLQHEEIDQSISRISQNEETLLKDQDTLLSNEEFRQLHQYEGALKSKGEEIEQFLQPLVKPLKKLERTLSSEEPIANRNTIIGIIENPKESISKLDSQIIHQALNALNDALNQGKIEIEERKRRRAQETIQAIGRGEMEQLRTKYLTLQKDIQTASDTLAANGLLDKSEKMKHMLKDTRSKREQLEAARSENSKKIEECTKTIARQKSLIESKITKLSGRQISIIT